MLSRWKKTRTLTTVRYLRTELSSAPHPVEPPPAHKMASGLYVTLLLSLVCGLWTAADARCLKKVHASHCTSGWTRYRNRCFVFINIYTDWASAERHCITLGGNLASFHSHNKLTFLRQLIRNGVGFNTNTWVGANDAAKEGAWMWSDGSSFTYSRWHRGEPNNTGGQENCMEINFRGGDHTNDERCYSKRPYICSKQL